jgi:uncharacterized OB-fold protein
MGRPLFLYSQCSSCQQVWKVPTEFCSKCQTGQWISDEWLEAEND